nr:MAG TPA: hypothetical protein [Caudoviricetes sp.]
MSHSCDLSRSIRRFLTVLPKSVKLYFKKNTSKLLTNTEKCNILSLMKTQITDFCQRLHDITAFCKCQA